MSKGRQIVDLKPAGKWVELWFVDGKQDPDRPDESCKWYMLDEAVDAAGLRLRVIKRGYLGLWMTWDGDRPSRVADTLFGLIEVPAGE